jgi:ubiquinone/menaquinone biosynthesis C-methylase UbiE
MKREDDLGYWKERTREHGGASVGYACNERMIRWDNVLRERAIKRFVTIRPGMNVLDAGTAAGYWAIKFAQAGANVTGLDFNPGILELAEANAQEAGVEVKWQSGALEEAELPQSFFDVVLSITCLQHVAEPARQLEAVRRVLRSLRPDGVFVLIEDTPSENDASADNYRLSYTHRGWIELVESQGGRILGYTGVSFLRFGPRRIPPVVWAGIDSVLGGIPSLRSRATVSAFAFGVKK